MTHDDRNDAGHTVDAVFAAHSRRVLATLIRLLGDFDLAEDALQEAFTAALQRWPREGLPEDPAAWLISAGRFRAIDRLRRNTRLREIREDIAERMEAVAERNAELASHEVEDDRLRLIFTCCHPAIDPRVQVPLTLREVCGLTTEEIARAFLTSTATMAQRIVRGKSKIRDAGIPYVVPAVNELPARLDAVLSVIYLVFNEGYSASAGDTLTRADLSQEAIRLARLLLSLLPDPEVMGLLALMLLHESRREARTSAAGEIVLLEDQDRSRWNRNDIAEGEQLVETALQSGPPGVYTLQAAISAVHATARDAAETDWPQIVALYSLLMRLDASPVILLNRAVAIAMNGDTETGLEQIDALLSRGELTRYHLAHSARGELLRRLGRRDEARSALRQALRFVAQDQERRFLRQRLAALSD